MNTRNALEVVDRLVDTWPILHCITPDRDFNRIPEVCRCPNCDLLTVIPNNRIDPPLMGATVYLARCPRCRGLFIWRVSTRRGTDWPSHTVRAAPHVIYYLRRPVYKFAAVVPEEWGLTTRAVVYHSYTDTPLDTHAFSFKLHPITRKIVMAVSGSAGALSR